MTSHYFENSLVKLHYYKFGSGAQTMLCFHGYGMHGKQFISLEPALGHKYTFIGFDLFFHQQTKLHDQSLPAIKRRISKKGFSALITEFLAHEHINRFSVIGYSMGTHYATVLAEEMGERIDEYLIAAPSNLDPGIITRFFGKYKIGNMLLERLTRSETALTRIFNFFNRVGIIDNTGRDILLKEIGTAQLRFNLYACFIYLRLFETDEPKLIKVLKEQNIRSIFIFGKRDKMYPPKIGKHFLKKLKRSEVIILDKDHEMIGPEFISALAGLLS